VTKHEFLSDFLCEKLEGERNSLFFLSQRFSILSPKKKNSNNSELNFNLCKLTWSSLKKESSIKQRKSCFESYFQQYHSNLWKALDFLDTFRQNKKICRLNQPKTY